MPILEIKNLSKNFGDIKVLNNVSLTVDKGDITNDNNDSSFLNNLLALGEKIILEKVNKNIDEFIKLFPAFPKLLLLFGMRFWLVIEDFLLFVAQFGLS